MMCKTRLVELFGNNVNVLVVVRLNFPPAFLCHSFLAALLVGRQQLGIFWEEVSALIKNPSIVENIGRIGELTGEVECQSNIKGVALSKVADMGGKSRNPLLYQERVNRSKCGV